MRAVLLVAGVLWSWLGVHAPASAALQELDTAHASITIEDTQTAGTVTLPYHWDRRHGGRSGIAEFNIPFTADRGAGLHGIYFLRIGNAYEIRLNGGLMQRNGDLQRFDGSDYAKAPRYVVVPEGLLRRDNVLQVRVRSDGGRRGGLARPVIGPDDEVRPLFQHEYSWRVLFSFALVILSLLVGTVALVLWMSQLRSAHPGDPSRDHVYLFAGVAELAWALRIGDALIAEPPMAWTVWGTLAAAALAVWLTSMAAFCMMLAGWGAGVRGTWIKRSLLGLATLGCAAAYASYEWDRTWMLTGWMIVASLYFACFTAAYIVSAWRSGNTAHRLMALALAMNWAAGLRDVVVFRILDSYGDNTWTRYSSTLFGLMLGYILISRFRAANAQARDLMLHLEKRVAQNRTELQQSYEREEHLAREQARQAERTRILRDMHDGVGSHISSAIRQLQSGKASKAHVLQTLRDSLDQLKLSVDALNMPQGDITALLANLRYRLEPRFAASDIELQWQVELIDPLPALDAAAMRHLQFIVFEALSNVLQHARAKVLRIEAVALGAGARLRIVDDGCGFDATQPVRRGLATMRERAVTIGAEITLTSEPGRTVVEVMVR